MRISAGQDGQDGQDGQEVCTEAEMITEMITNLNFLQIIALVVVCARETVLIRAPGIGVISSLL